MDSVSLYHTIAETLGIPANTVNENSDMENTENWDSLRQVILMTEFERILEVEFTPDEMTDAKSVKKIKEILSHKGVAIP